MQGPQPKRAVIPGSSPAIFDRRSFGYPLDVDYGNFQIVCDGLAGGTYTVAARASGSAVFRNIKTGAVEADFVLLDDGFDVDAIRVTYDGLGEAAAPIARLSATGRGYAWGG